MNKRKIKRTFNYFWMFITCTLLILNAINALSLPFYKVNLRYYLNIDPMIWYGFLIPILIKTIVNYRISNDKFNYKQRAYLMKISALLLWSPLTIALVFFNTKLQYVEDTLLIAVLGMVWAIKVSVLIVYRLYRFIDSANGFSLQGVLDFPLIAFLSHLPIVSRVSDLLHSLSYRSRRQKGRRLQVLLIVLLFYAFESVNRLALFSFFMMVFIILFLASELLTYQFNLDLGRVKSRYRSLDCLDFFELPLIIVDQNQKITTDSRVFELDFTHLIDAKASDVELVSSDHDFIGCSGHGHLKLLLAVCVGKARSYILDGLKIKYHLNGKDRVLELLVSLDFVVMGHEFMLESACVHDRDDVPKDALSYRAFKKSQVRDIDGLRYLDLLSHYYNGPRLHDLTFSAQTHQRQKFLVIDGADKEGESLSLRVSLNEEGMRGLPISFWKLNSIDSNLALLYRRVRAESRRKSFPIHPETLWVSVLIVVLTVLFFELCLQLFLNHRAVLLFLNDVKAIMVVNPALSPAFVHFLLSPLFVLLLALITGFLLARRFAPDLLMLRSPSTQAYCLSYIKAVLLEESWVLVFEDIDFMDVKGMNRVFQLMASLNDVFLDCNRVVGIAPMDVVRVRQKFALDPLSLVGEFDNQLNHFVQKPFLKLDWAESCRNYLYRIVNYYTLCCDYHGTPRNRKQIILSEVLIAKGDYSAVSRERLTQFVSLCQATLFSVGKATGVNDKQIQLELASMGRVKG